MLRVDRSSVDQLALACASIGSCGPMARHCSDQSIGRSVRRLTLNPRGSRPPYAPMDFAGWFEAYLCGRWYTFDPRNNMPRIGRVLIAQGRDAADVPITHTFGPNTLVSFKVWTDEVS